MSALFRTEVLATLRRARTRLTPIAHWTQNDFAQQANGLGCAFGSTLAVCWCLHGALITECFFAPAAFQSADEQPRLQLEVLRYVDAAAGVRNTGLTLVGWNDTPGRQHDDVLAVLDKAIAACARDLSADASGPTEVRA